MAGFMTRDSAPQRPFFAASQLASTLWGWPNTWSDRGGLEIWWRSMSALGQKLTFNDDW